MASLKNKDQKPTNKNVKWTTIVGDDKQKTPKRPVPPQRYPGSHGPKPKKTLQYKSGGMYEAAVDKAATKAHIDDILMSKSNNKLVKGVSKARQDEALKRKKAEVERRSENAIRNTYKKGGCVSKKFKCGGKMKKKC